MEQAKRNEAIGESLDLAGGFAVLGTAITGSVAAVGEVVDRLISNGENFPGGTVAKIAGGLAVVAAGLITSGHYVQERPIEQ